MPKKNKVGRKPVATAQKKKTIGVGLSKAQIDQLDTERKNDYNGIMPQLSVYARYCIVSYLTLRGLVRDGKITPRVLSLVNERIG